MYQIIFYIDKNGKSEIFEYIENLRANKKDKDSKIKLNKITAYLNQLPKHGFSLGEPYIKHLDAEIWELRPIRDRILFAYWNNSKFVLLSHFIKQTQKTPQREILKAKRLLKEHKERSNEL